METASQPLRLLARAWLAISLVGLLAPVAVAQSLAPPAATIVVDPPLAEPLSRGVVFIHYRTEHLLLVPVFGPKALEVSPPIGHLHVALDGAPWGWGHTSGDPLIIFGLPAGPHRLEITLVNPNHRPLGRSLVEFVIPPRDAAGGVASIGQAHGDELASKLSRREIQRSPSLIPGREIVQVETLIPGGVESGWHTHPGEEIGYIIAGQVEMMVEGRPTVVLHPGEGFLIPARTPHNARDIGPETGRMLSTYLVEAGQPIATLVDQPVHR